jgi:hypothetical protein
MVFRAAVDRVGRGVQEGHRELPGLVRDERDLRLNRPADLGHSAELARRCATGAPALVDHQHHQRHRREPQGVELSLQAPFKFLPGFLSNFGGIVNATFVDSKAIYNPVGPTVVTCVPPTTPTGACAFGPNVGTTRESTLFGLSETAWNATLYYEDSRFSARTSVAYRGPYVDQNSGTGNIFEGYNSAFNVDASVRYKITEQFEVSIEGTNPHRRLSRSLHRFRCQPEL